MTRRANPRGRHVWPADDPRQRQRVKELYRLLGIEHLRTTTYHLASNGMVERLHRQLKAAIKCHDMSNWVEILPIVLLGIRTAIKEELNATAAEMIYGAGIRLPGEFFVPMVRQATFEYANRLKERIEKIKPQPITRQTCSFSVNSQCHPIYCCVATSSAVPYKHLATGHTRWYKAERRIST